MQLSLKSYQNRYFVTPRHVVQRVLKDFCNRRLFWQDQSGSATVCSTQYSGGLYVFKIRHIFCNFHSNPTKIDILLRQGMSYNAFYRLFVIEGCFGKTSLAARLSVVLNTAVCMFLKLDISFATFTQILPKSIFCYAKACPTTRFKCFL